MRAWQTATKDGDRAYLRDVSQVHGRGPVRLGIPGGVNIGSTPLNHLQAQPVPSKERTADSVKGGEECDFVFWEVQRSLPLSRAVLIPNDVRPLLTQTDASEHATTPDTFRLRSKERSGARMHEMLINHVARRRITRRTPC